MFTGFLEQLGATPNCKTVSLLIIHFKTKWFPNNI